MHRGMTVCVLAGLTAVGSVGARTPQNLKDDLAKVLPAGKMAKFAWSSGGSIGNYRSGTKIKVTDSQTGIIRELVPGATGQTFGTLYHPQITYDGKRVIFTDPDGLDMYVINWDGTGLRSLGFGYVCDYYYNAAGKSDWVVRNDGASYTSNLKMINIDTLTKSKVVWSGAKDGDADDGIGVSSDGLWVASYFGDDRAAVAQIPSGSLTAATDYATQRGCVLSIAPDNHDFMHQSGAHITVQGYSGANGTKIFDIDITNPIKTWAQGSGRTNNCAPGQAHDATRWASTDRNYVTSMMQFTKVNPFLIKLSNPIQFAYIDTQTVCNEANSDMDVRFWDAVSVAEKAPRLSPTSRSARVESFGINGRRLSSVAGRHVEGIVIQRGETGATLRAEIVR